MSATRSEICSPDEAGRTAGTALAATSREAALLRDWDNQFVWHPFTPMLAYRDEGAPDHRGGRRLPSDRCPRGGNISTAFRRFGATFTDIASWKSIGPFASNSIESHTRRCWALSSVPSIALASELVARAPRGLTKVFYSDSGATAVEVALKIAYQYQAQKAGAREGSRRDRFLCLGNAYHGDTIGTVSVGGIPLFHAAYRDLLFETVSVPSPVAFRTPNGFTPAAYLDHCFAELERLIVENRDRAVGFIMEPLVQGAAGILVQAIRN